MRAGQLILIFFISILASRTYIDLDLIYCEIQARGEGLMIRVQRVEGVRWEGQRRLTHDRHLKDRLCFDRERDSRASLVLESQRLYLHCSA